MTFQEIIETIDHPLCTKKDAEMQKKNEDKMKQKIDNSDRYRGKINMKVFNDIMAKRSLKY